MPDLLSPEAANEAARRVIAAWEMAVNGDAAELTAIATSADVVHWLLHPAMERWHVGPGPEVTQVRNLVLDQAAQPPSARLRFDFAGAQVFDDGQVVRTLFVGLLELTVPADEQPAWQLSSGHVSTLDKFLGYVFTSRAETAEEWRKRTGSQDDPVRLAGQARQFTIISGFAEHDERLGATATTVVRRETEPTRYEAEELIWPVIDQITAEALGPGDWRPSMNWLDVIELLGEPDR